ncbi:MAG TPA: hypothetical protein VMW25_05820, partial [Clostridia bacterium]|nr:hypothetical protein [Clostridia bacterium]
MMNNSVFEKKDIPSELRQYFEEIAVQCGAQWARVVEKESYSPPIVGIDERNVDKSRGDKNRALSGTDYNKQANSTTLGWRP